MTLESEQQENLSDTKLDSFVAQLVALVDRMVVLTDVFRYSMETEFWPSEGSANDWKDNLNFLKESVVLITHLREVNPEEAEKLELGNGRSLDSWLKWYNSRILAAQQCLESGQFVPTANGNGTSAEHYLNLIWRSTEEVRKALNAAKMLRDILGTPEINGINGFLSVFESHQERYTSQKEQACTLYKTLVKRAHELSTSGNTAGSDIERCTVSRKLYLVANYIAFRFPLEWKSERNYQRDFAQAHSSLLRSMAPGTSFRRSASSRAEDGDGIIDRFAA